MTFPKICFSISMILLLSFTFTGQSEDQFKLPELKPPNFRVKINVSSMKQEPFETLMKGYLLQELRKIPDVTIVDQDEEYVISIVPTEVRGAGAIVYSMLIVMPFDPTSLEYHTRGWAGSLKENGQRYGPGSHKWHLDQVKFLTSTLYYVLDHGVFVCPRNDLEGSCRDCIVTFDAEHLEPVRQMYKRGNKE